MDAGGLIILLKEMEADCVVARDAAQKAALHLRQESSGRLEACAYGLSRFYNVLERMFERICEEFENHFEKRGDFHEKLIQRLALNLEGIRPAFIPHDRAPDSAARTGNIQHSTFNLEPKNERRCRRQSADCATGRENLNRSR